MLLQGRLSSSVLPYIHTYIHANIPPVICNGALVAEAMPARHKAVPSRSRPTASRH